MLSLKTGNITNGRDCVTRLYEQNDNENTRIVLAYVNAILKLQ